MAETVERNTGTREVTDQELIDYLKEHDSLANQFKTKVDELLNDLSFLQDDSWIQHAIDGLKKPNIGTRLERQLTKTVTKTLRNEAFEEAVKTGKPPVDPSKEDIQTEVQNKIAARTKKLQQDKDLKLIKAKAAIHSGE